MRKIKEKLGRRYKVLLGLSIVFIGFGLFVFSPKSVIAEINGGWVNSLWYHSDVFMSADNMVESSDGNFIYVTGRKYIGMDSVTQIKKIAKNSGNTVWENIGDRQDGIFVTYTSVTSWSNRVFTAEGNPGLEDYILQEWVVNPDESLSKGWRITSGLLIHDITSDENNLYIIGNKGVNHILQSRSKIDGALNWEVFFPALMFRHYEIEADSTGVYITYGVSRESDLYKIGKYNKNSGANLWTTHVYGGFVNSIDINSNHLYVNHIRLGSSGLRSFSLTDGSLEWQTAGGELHLSATDDFIYGVAVGLFSIFDLDGNLFGAVDSSSWDHWRLLTQNMGTFGAITLKESENLFTTYILSSKSIGGRDSGIILNKIQFGFNDFTLSVTPLRDVANPNWMRDYSVSITRQGGFNDAVTLSSSVAIGGADLNITWPDGNTIPAGYTGPKIMRVQAKDPPTESKRATNYDITITAVGGGITKNQEVDFYINQRPNAKDRAIGQTSINVGQSVKIRDDGSADMDTLAPGNALMAVIADFDNDATLDLGGNLIGIDKCFIVGDTTGTICNTLWPGSASPNPGDPTGWSFQYNVAGAYSIRYFVFDDLIADAQAVNWTERFKSAGMATAIPVTVGPAPGQAPTAVIEIQNDNGMPIDQALPGQMFYAYVGGSTDPDGTISQVSFCVDTTPEPGGSPKICDGSVMNWTFPPFDWNTPDLERNWLAIAKKLRGQISQPGTYAIYTAVTDNTGMLSPVAMDTITILTLPPPTADDQSVSTNQNTAVDVTLSGVKGVDGVVQISAGFRHSLFLRSNGSVWASGLGSEGELGGIQITFPTVNPIRVVGPGGIGYLDNIIEVAAGVNYSLAVKSDGTVWAWGSNALGQLGDGTQDNRFIPVQVIGLTDVVAIAVGNQFSLQQSYSLAVKSDGTVWAWGGNAFGQLGDGTTIQRLTPVQVSGLSEVISIGASSNFNIDTIAPHSLVAKSDGTVWAWGGNAFGQLGDGTTIQRLTPVQVGGGLSNIVSVSAGYNFSLALKSDGTVWAWGRNESTQLGDGTIIDKMTPIQIAGLAEVVDIDGGSGHSLVAKSDGTVWAWGFGYVGDGDVFGGLHPNPVRVKKLDGNNLDNIMYVSAGVTHSLAVKSDGTAAWGWGNGQQGQLGDGNLLGRNAAVQTQFLLSFTITSLPVNGTLKTSAGTAITSVPYTLTDNIVNYTPNLDFVSPPIDPFQFKVNDGVQDSAPGTVSITVIGIGNQKPIARFSALPSISGPAPLTVNFRDGDVNGPSYDPDPLPPGNDIAIFIADLDGNSIVDKCFIPLIYTSSVECNDIWPGSNPYLPSDPNYLTTDPRTNDWTQVYSSSQVARYAVFDDLSTMSDVVSLNVDIIPLPKTLKVCIEKCDGGGSTLIDDTLTLGRNQKETLTACFNTAAIDGVNDCSDASGDVTDPLSTTWTATNLPDDSINLNYKPVPNVQEVSADTGITGNERVEVNHLAIDYFFTVHVPAACVPSCTPDNTRCKWDKTDSCGNVNGCPDGKKACRGNWREVPPQ